MWRKKWRQRGHWQDRRKNTLRRPETAAEPGPKGCIGEKKWGWTKNATTGDQAVKARPGSSHDLLQSSQESVRMHSNVNTQDRYRWHTQTWQYKVCEQQRGLFVYLGLCAFLFRRGLYTISHLKREKKKKEKKKAVVVNKTPYWEVNHTQSTSSILSEEVPYTRVRYSIITCGFVGECVCVCVCVCGCGCVISVVINLFSGLTVMCLNNSVCLYISSWNYHV